MPENTPYSDLKEAIKNLEKEQAIRGQLLKDQFKTTYENLSPLNLIKNSLVSFAESPEIKTSLIDILIALTSGLISRKIFSGNRKDSSLNKAATLLISGLNSYVARNPEVVRSIGNYLIDLFRKKKSTEKLKNKNTGLSE